MINYVFIVTTRVKSRMYSSNAYIIFVPPHRNSRNGPRHDGQQIGCVCTPRGLTMRSVRITGNDDGKHDIILYYTYYVPLKRSAGCTGERGKK